MKFLLKNSIFLSCICLFTILPACCTDNTTVNVNIYFQQVEKNIDNKGIKMMKNIGARQWADQNETAMKVNYSKEIINALKHANNDKAIDLCYKGLEYEKYVPQTIIANYYHYIGLAYLKKQNYSKAIQNYNIAIKNYNANDDKIYYERGLARLKINDLDGAKEDYNKSLSLGLKIENELPDGTKTYDYLKDKVTIQNNDISILNFFVMPIMEKYGKLALINTNIEKGKYEIILEFYNNRIKHNYKLAETYNNRGVYYLEQKSYTQAFNDFQESIKINENLKEPYFNLALLYYSIGEYNNAMQNINKFFELKSKTTENYSAYSYGTVNGETYSNNDTFIDEILKANIELKLQNDNVANTIYDKYKVNNFNETYKLPIEYLPLLEGKAFQYINQKKYKKARNYLYELLTADYDSYSGTNKQRGKYYYFTEQNDFNIKKGHEVIENAYIFSNIALMEYYMGKQDLAIEDIQKAKEISFKFNNIDLYKRIVDTYNFITKSK